MTTEEVVRTLMRLARMDSGLSESDREALFQAYCFCLAQWDLLELTLKKSEPAEHGRPQPSGFYSAREEK